MNRNAARIALGAVAAALLLAAVDPTEARWFPRCPFRSLTGWNCPGCGTARAIRSAALGDWTRAFRCNPFLLVLLPALVLAVVRPAWTDNRFFLFALAGGAVLWTVLRNVLPALAIPA